jgi:hypothetical protein
MFGKGTVATYVQNLCRRISEIYLLLSRGTVKVILSQDEKEKVYFSQEENRNVHFAGRVRETSTNTYQDTEKENV